MRRYSEAVKRKASAKHWPYVSKRMSPPHRQSVARNSEELGIQAITLYKWRKAWRMVLTYSMRSTSSEAW
jgi:transposase-like protein